MFPMLLAVGKSIPIIGDIISSFDSSDTSKVKGKNGTRNKRKPIDEYSDSNYDNYSQQPPNINNNSKKYPDF